MTDTSTQRQRSEIMSRIRSKDTKPEMIVRRLMYGMGYRYRLHVRKLPGTPDIVMRRRNKIIEVRGCFWHGHANCPDSKIPKTREEFWMKKIKDTQIRDAKNISLLKQDGWQILEIWECELKDIEAVKTKLITYLKSPSHLHN